MDNDKNFMLLSLVAIVAIIGVVFMTGFVKTSNNGGAATFSQASYQQEPIAYRMDQECYDQYKENMNLCNQFAKGDACAKYVEYKYDECKKDMPLGSGQNMAAQGIKNICRIETIQQKGITCRVSVCYGDTIEVGNDPICFTSDGEELDLNARNIGGHAGDVPISLENKCLTRYNNCLATGNDDLCLINYEACISQGMGYHLEQHVE